MAPPLLGISSQASDVPLEREVTALRRLGCRWRSCPACGIAVSAVRDEISSRDNTRFQAGDGADQVGG